MRYYVMLPDSSVVPGWRKAEPSPLFQGPDWLDDGPLTHGYKEVSIVYSGKQLRDIDSTGHYDVYSIDAVTAIKDAGETHFDEFPVVLRPISGKPRRDTHRVLRLTDRLCCMNLDESEYDVADGALKGVNPIRNVRKLVLLEEAIPPDRHFFQEAVSYALIASERLVDILDSRHITGLAPVREGDIANHWRSGRARIREISDVD